MLDPTAPFIGSEQQILDKTSDTAFKGQIAAGVIVALAVTVFAAAIYCFANQNVGGGLGLTLLGGVLVYGGYNVGMVFANVRRIGRTPHIIKEGDNPVARKANAIANWVLNQDNIDELKLQDQLAKGTFLFRAISDYLITEALKEARGPSN